jgi:hypothetical protein
MTDDQLRALVREAVARQLGTVGTPQPLAAFEPGGISAVPPGAAVTVAAAHGGVAVAAGPGAVVQVHISHAVFTLPGAIDGTDSGPCRTEPHSDCTRCGFCQSYGY